MRFLRMMPKKRRYILVSLAVIIIIAALLWAGARSVGVSQARPPVGPGAGAAERGAAAFVGAGFGGISLAALESNAVPWKLVAAALVLEEQARDPQAGMDLVTLQTVLARFGFLYPETLADLPPGIDYKAGPVPLGMTHGYIAPVGGARIEVANLGCAACHAGVAYDARGNPLPGRAAPGMPNTSLNLEAYTDAVFVALRNHTNGDALLDAAQALFPEMDWRERASLRFIVLPLARSRLSELSGASRAMPFPNGLPGMTNGVAALKAQLGTPLLGSGMEDRGFVSVPELGSRIWRSRLLVDGAYGIPESTTDKAQALAAITSFFTVPSMGVHPDAARGGFKDVEDIFAWLALYRPEPFPGEVDRVLARKGEAAYAAACAGCHGDFAWDEALPRLVRYREWIGDVGTDTLRSRTFDASLAGAISDTAYRGVIDVSPGEGYAAVPLAGLWASAPYLHNGSVQSLAALLDPRLRKRRFMVGGHALDFDTVGLKLAEDGRFPPGYLPFSQPEWVDTGEPGLGNGGHEFGSDLSVDDRRALLEFLKLL